MRGRSGGSSEGGERLRELASIRSDINSVDSAIRELFLLRMSLAHEVAETKAQSDDKIYKPDREAEIIEQRPPAWRRRSVSSTSPCSRA